MMRTGESRMPKRVVLRACAVLFSAAETVTQQPPSKTAPAMAKRAYVMKSGSIVLEKPAAELLGSQESWWESY